MKPAVPMQMWAAVIQGQRGEWINHATIRFRRCDAKEAYCEMWLPEHRKRALENVRFAKVTVSLTEPN